MIFKTMFKYDLIYTYTHMKWNLKSICLGNNDIHKDVLFTNGDLIYTPIFYLIYAKYVTSDSCKCIVKYNSSLVDWRAWCHGCSYVAMERRPGWLHIRN